MQCQSKVVKVVVFMSCFYLIKVLSGKIQVRQMCLIIGDVGGKKA